MQRPHDGPHLAHFREERWELLVDSGASNSYEMDFQVWA